MEESMKYRIYLPRVKLLFLFSIFVFLSASHHSALAGSPIDDLPVLQGDPQGLLKNRTSMLLVFWATWCPDCKQKLKQVLPGVAHDNEVAIVTVSTESESKRVNEFLASEKIVLPVVFDHDRKLRKSLKLFSVPAWAVYRRAGAEWILSKADSAFSEESIERALGKDLFQ
jgi:thiol-disulfide isomerase/thioredoxin